VLSPYLSSFSSSIHHNHLEERKLMKIFRAALILGVLGLMRHSAPAQITIGPDRIPAVGDEFTTVPMDTTNVEEGTAGGNKTWNFSNLTVAGPSQTIKYANASATPYTGQFPGANLASIVVDGNDTSYTYFSTASNKLTSLGYASGNGIMKYNNTEIQLATPLTFNDQFSDLFAGSWAGEGWEVRTGGSISLHNDSYGTILLPGGVASPAARVKFVRQTNDTGFVGGIPFYMSRMTTTSYEWFIPGLKFPVLQIAYYVTVANGNTTAYKHVEYNTHTATGVESRTQSGVAADFRLDQNFPNPFNPSTTIGFQIPQSGKVSLKVYDLLGREVATLVDEELSSGIYSIPFDAQGLASGTYLYRLQTGTTVLSRKLTLIK
jgi:hypothetical protein